ncbi:hypothetical protein D082_40140 (plasmid) [Synechocystis sp. PCC 6714]|nr:hypothetical protein D082_40140 [Synechocystis sp. PCC 6714]
MKAQVDDWFSLANRNHLDNNIVGCFFRYAKSLSAPYCIGTN